jgi:hypothetical protein
VLGIGSNDLLSGESTHLLLLLSLSGCFCTAVLLSTAAKSSVNWCMYFYEEHIFGWPSPLSTV